MVTEEQVVVVLHVSDVMSTDVVKVIPNDSVHLAVSKMIESSVGCTIVIDDVDKVVGIITKGDVLKRAFLKDLDSRKLKASEVMTKPVLTTEANETVEVASRTMTANGISKLPVLREDKLVGIITATDIIRAEPLTVGYLQELVRARFVPHDLRSLH
jgi:CBS domain-containing protein